MSDRPPAKRALAARLRLARVALVWERVWPALWPTLGVLGVFAVAALFDVLPLLPAAAHAGVLALLGVALAATLWRGWRAAGLRPLPDTVAARRRIEEASGLRHRPLAALADRPSGPLDGPAGVLWAAHQRRMAAAVRRLRVGWPAAGLARRDPWGVRAVLAMLLLLGAVDAGADWRDRLLRAFSPNLAGGAPALAASFDLWLTPPEYTGLAPQFLRAGDRETVRVPTGSVLLAQVHGGNAVPSLAVDAEARDFAAIDKHNFRVEATLTAGTSLALKLGGATLGRWTIEILPDKPPTIAFAQSPKATPRSALRLDYRAGDDYGVESAKLVIRRTASAENAGPVGEAMEFELPLPGIHLKEAEGTSYQDLSPHPWAGLPVELRLVATDALGQIGESEPVRMNLPERAFHHPIARAIIDQRKELAKDPRSGDAVAEILGDLNRRPQLYGEDVVVYLALRLATQRLRHDKDPDTIGAVEQLMWDTALRLEDGHMSLAERELRRVQQQLQEALAKGAPDSEIERLMQELQQALDRYLQALAQDLQNHPNEAAEPMDPSRALTGRDLQRMLDRARDLARSGSRDQAREMLSQLQNMLENLRAAQPGQMQQRGASEAQKMMRGLRDLMQRQQQLLDRSFRAQRQQGPQSRDGRPGQQPGQPSGRQPGQQQPGQDPGEEQADSGEMGENGEMGDAAGQQEGLRRGLGEIMRQLGEAAGEIPEPFGRAERAMRDAAGALQRGQPSQAIRPQTEALDQLQQATRDFAQQLQRRLGTARGDPNGGEVGATDRDPRDREERDPFGRPMSNNGMIDRGDVKIPDQNILQKSRQILDELRRRAGERFRPSIELEYIERLLKRF